MIKIFTIIKLCVLLLLAIGCGGNNDPVTVKYVLPDNYKGYIWVALDPVQGKEVRPNANNEIILKIPSDGILLVKDDGFLLRPHRLTASNYSGEKIPVEYYDKTTVTENALRGISTSSSNIHTSIFGKRSVVDNYRKLQHPESWEARKEFKKRLGDRKRDRSAL